MVTIDLDLWIEIYFSISRRHQMCERYRRLATQ